MSPDAAAAGLRAVVARCGTPAYAYDADVLAGRISRLRAGLPAAVDLLYSLKANPSPGLCAWIARWGLGADVASAGELSIALAAGFPPARIVLGAPYVSPDSLALLDEAPAVLLSLDSAGELARLAAGGRRRRGLLRLRPDFPVTGALMATGPDSRFGIPAAELSGCRRHLGGDFSLVGFHVYCGSQTLDTSALVEQLEKSLDLALRAADTLGVEPEVFDLGGGFGVPYGPGEQEIDLDVLGEALERLAAAARPAKIVLELGRYVVAPAGWYLTSVVGRQSHRGRPAVVVDGGIHQRSDLCGLGLRTAGRPPVLLAGRDGTPVPTDVLGCLCLPSDVLAEACPLPELEPGDVLAFADAGAYGASASPLAFLGHPAPAEVLFSGSELELLRPPAGPPAVRASEAPSPGLAAERRR